MQDFNIRSEDEMLWKPSPDVTDELDLFLQELDLLFSIEKSTVMGQRKMGMSIERMLWSTSFPADMMSTKIKEEIEQFSLMNQFFRWSVTVELMKGVARDIGVITVTIADSSGSTVAAPTFIFK
jgi:hypothetical protein